MAGFRKAKAEQAALKTAFYGPPGSGKTFTVLLVAEGLAALTGKRVAFVDTERGTDFYVKAVPQRKAHPEAFDIDSIYTRSITEVLKEVRGLKPDEHSVLVIDSISHIWDAIAASYNGKRTSQGGIPINAWNKLKAPYKELMHFVINSPFHVFLLGRQGTEFENDEEGEMKAVGVKMRAEKETMYEPHVCIRMEAVYAKARGKRVGEAVPTAFVEKDRSGILHGTVIPWPGFSSLAQPLLPLLGETQAQVQSEDEAGQADAEALERAEREKAKASKIRREQFEARLKLAKDLKEVKAIAKEITPELKKQMLGNDLQMLRNAYLEAEARATGQPYQSNGNGNGHAEDDDEPERTAIREAR